MAESISGLANWVISNLKARISQDSQGHTGQEPDYFGILVAPLEKRISGPECREVYTSMLKAGIPPPLPVGSYEPADGKHCMNLIINSMFLEQTGPESMKLVLDINPLGKRSLTGVDACVWVHAPAHRVIYFCRGNASISGHYLTIMDPVVTVNKWPLPRPAGQASETIQQ